MLTLDQFEQQIDDLRMQVKLRRTEQLQSAIEAVRQLQKLGLTAEQLAELRAAVAAVAAVEEVIRG